MTEDTEAALMRAGAQIEALRQQLQAAREANTIHGAAMERAEMDLEIARAKRDERDEKAQMEDVVREVLCRAFPDGTELIPAFYEWYDASQWLWWGRALGAFIGTEARKREAEVWEEAEKMAEEWLLPQPELIHEGERMNELVTDIAAALRQRKTPLPVATSTEAVLAMQDSVIDQCRAKVIDLEQQLSDAQETIRNFNRYR